MFVHLEAVTRGAFYAHSSLGHSLIPPCMESMQTRAKEQRSLAFWGRFKLQSAKAQFRVELRPILTAEVTSQSEVEGTRMHLCAPTGDNWPLHSGANCPGSENRTYATPTDHSKLIYDPPIGLSTNLFLSHVCASKILRVWAQARTLGR